MNRYNKKSPKYLTFPIALIKNGFEDIRRVVDEAMEYCLYDTSERLLDSEIEPIKAAASKLGIKYGNLINSYNRGKILYDSIDEHCPKTSISSEILFDFYKYDKSEFEVVCFLAFAAIRSILQRQVYCRITNDYLFSRMAGNSKKGQPIPDWLNKYSGHYWSRKIRSELELNWGLKVYSKNTRGFYISFQMDPTQLAEAAIKRSRKSKIKQLKEEKEQAYLIAIQKVYGGFNPSPLKVAPF